MAEPYCFGRFTLNPAERRLFADGAVVPLGATACNVLLALVERAGTLVTKDELMARVWGRASVGDNTLHVHINLLRKTLGDDCIATRQGRGYRFVAPVERTQARPPSADPHAGNLPAFWTATDGPARLIGRHEQLRAVSEFLARSRLVTLTGPGGVGKTRLAVQAAGKNSATLPDGAWLVELAALKDPELVPAAVAAVLDIKIGHNATPLDTLARHLARRSLLIVLDNCEHVIMAAALLCETLLGAAPGIKILATSREALSCSGEQAFEVPPLELPHEGAVLPDAMRAMAAIELFAERARGASASFKMDDAEVPIAARICRRLDGLPLAIEMVAGWAGTLGLKALDAEFDGPAHAWLRAGSTAPARHATLRATLEWSHDLLSPAERLFLCRVAVFAGGFTLEAAKSVTSGDGIPPGQVFEYLGSLIRKSMIACVPGTRRYRLLETMRAFMLEKLAASEEAEMLRQRHALYVLQTLEGAMNEWETAGDIVWLERHRTILDDLRNALDWAMGQNSDAAVAIAGASWPLWRDLSQWVEGRQRLGAAASRLRPDTPPAQEARLRRGLGDMWSNTAAKNMALAELARAVALYRSLNEIPHLGSALASQGYALLMLDRPEEAEQSIAEALALLEHAGRPRALLTAYSTQLCIESRLGHLEAARAAGEKAVRLCELWGADRSAFVVTGNLVEAALEMGDFDGAVIAGRDLAARLRCTSHSDLLGFVLGVLTAALTRRGDLDDALTTAREAAPLLRDHDWLFWLFDHLALRLELAGHARDAARIAGYADTVYRTFDCPREPIGRRAVERLALRLRNALPEESIVQLKREGAQLTEEQAMTVALAGVGPDIATKVDTSDAASRAGALEAAKLWLFGLLVTGAVPVKQIEGMARQKGHAWATVRRAKAALGANSVKAGASGGWAWQIPDGLKSA